MAKYRRTERQYRDIGASERRFRDEVIDTEAIDEKYVDSLRQRSKRAEPPKARIVKRANTAASKR
jgi:hypothetical protein